MNASVRILVLTRDDNDREQWKHVWTLSGHFPPATALNTYFHNEEPDAGTYRAEGPGGTATLTWDGDKVLAA